MKLYFANINEILNKIYAITVLKKRRWKNFNIRLLSNLCYGIYWNMIEN